MSIDVVFVDRRGVAQRGGHPMLRAVAESEAITSLLANAVPPPACGPDMPVAPGRGPMLAFTPREMVQTDAGNFVRRHAGYRNRDAARLADAFDRITLASQKAHARKGSKAGPFVPPFTHGQVQAGRDYAALVERCESSGVKCSSLETQFGSGSGNGDREEAMLADFKRRRMLERRIGDGLAKDVRRPSKGGARSAIRVLDLVRQVCCGGKSLADVLKLHGWHANDKAAKAAIIGALRSALDRMQGFDLVQPQNVA